MFFEFFCLSIAENWSQKGKFLKRMQNITLSFIPLVEMLKGGRLPREHELLYLRSYARKKKFYF